MRTLGENGGRLFGSGFEGLFNNINVFETDKDAPPNTRFTKYPPYNIRKIEENKHVIELALAGFKAHEVEVELDGRNLKISGQSESDKEIKESEYLHRGIASRSFQRNFVLGENIQVGAAEMVDGMLRIRLEEIIPESKKPKKIKVENKS